MRHMQRPLIDGRYVLGETIGSGGMAEVYLARDEVLGRDVALKVLRGQYANDEEFVERFRREARNAAALNHPSIVQVYDQGHTQDGAHYIAMEYVPGGTLAQRIKAAGPLDPGEAVGVASRVAEALAVAHARGIIHRDIKPQNVLLTTSGDAKVTDFGIARAASAKTITETSLIMGTAAYMSPEQVRGERVGPASDLYSLGAVLYEMLTGEPPYSADNPVATAMKHLDEPPRHPRDANPAVPQDLDALTAKLLAKRPEDRYASAADLAEDLRRARAGLPLLAAGLGQHTTRRMPPETDETRVAPAAPGGHSRRRGFLPLAALGLALILLGGLAWALSSGLLGGSPPSGSRPVEVPDLTGLSLEEAQGRLEEVGLRLGSREEAVSEEFEAGAVIQQVPPAGTESERGSAVDVVVSSGPAAEPTTQPSTSSATSSASSSASPPASSTSTATTPGNEGEPAQDPGAQEAAEEAAKRAQERAEEQQKALKEARKEAAKRQEERGKAQKGGKGED
jgi:eukaryotic-like serine/threonine-protein kinase